MLKVEPDLSHIAAPLRHLAVPLESLTPDPDNARRHPEDNIDAIMRSLAEFGQDQPLVVREEGRVVIKGNGRWEAARALGWTHVAAVLVSESEVRAAARALADNRSGELAEWDDAVLARVIERVRASDEVSTDATGFTPEDVAAVLARARAALAGPGSTAGDPDAVPVPGGHVGDSDIGSANDPLAEWQGMPEFEHDDLTEGAAFTIRVYLKDEEDLAALGRLLGKDLTGRKFVWFGKQPIGEKYEAVDG
jgi:ParB/RepB/Spo0J family partition protein